MVKHTQPDVLDLTVVSFTKVKKEKHWTIFWAKRRSEQEWRGQGEFKSVAIKQCFVLLPQKQALTVEFRDKKAGKAPANKHHSIILFCPAQNRKNW